MIDKEDGVRFIQRKNCMEDSKWCRTEAIHIKHSGYIYSTVTGT